MYVRFCMFKKMIINFRKTLDTVYTLNLNNYLDRNPQLIDAVEWNRKFYNVILVDESDKIINNIIKTDPIFNWLKNNLKYKHACDYLRFKLIANYNYNCFIDMDIILIDNMLSNYENYIARYYDTNKINCSIIKGNKLAKKYYEWFLKNYLEYTIDSDLPDYLPNSNNIDWIHLFNNESEKPIEDIFDKKFKSIKDYLNNRPNSFYRYSK